MSKASGTTRVSSKSSPRGLTEQTASVSARQVITREMLAESAREKRRAISAQWDALGFTKDARAALDIARPDTFANTVKVEAADNGSTIKFTNLSESQWMSMIRKLESNGFILGDISDYIGGRGLQGEGTINII